jgi:hypothetical protein
MSERFIGKRRFVDGEVRLVFQDERGQFVLDEDGEPASKDGRRVVGFGWVSRNENAARRSKARRKLRKQNNGPQTAPREGRYGTFWLCLTDQRR